MTVSTRHLRRGTMGLWLVDTVADHTAPTVTEIDGGTNVTGHVRDLTGFQVTRDPVLLGTVDGYGSRLSVLGDPTPGVPTLTLYDEGSGSAAVRTAMAFSEAFCLVFTLDAQTAADGDRAQVWPVVSAGPVDLLTGGVEAAVYTVTFALWSAPQTDATIDT